MSRLGGLLGGLAPVSLSELEERASLQRDDKYLSAAGARAKLRSRLYADSGISAVEVKVKRADAETATRTLSSAGSPSAGCGRSDSRGVRCSERGTPTP